MVGKPRQEDFFIGDLLQELLSPLFPLVMPAVEQLWSYGETGYHSLAGAVVKQRYKREAMASAFRILGEGQLSLTKFLLLTDRLVDLKDFRATLEHVLARTDPQTDLYVFSNLSMDTLDYTGPVVNEGSKGVWLGLGDPVRELPRAFAPAGAAAVGRDRRAGVLRRLPGRRRAAVRRGPATRRRASPAHPAFAGWPLVVVSDEPARATRSDMNFLWTTFTRFEPAADIHAAAQRVVRQSHRLRAADRHRRAHEAVVSEGGHVPRRHRGTVTERWREYFPSAASRWAIRSAGIWIDDHVASGPRDLRPDDRYNQCVSDTTTNGIRVQVTTKYLPERSSPREQASTGSPTSSGSRTSATRRRSWSAGTG